MKKLGHDKEHDIVTVEWWSKSDEHIGWTEEINLGGITILVDRNKKGKVRALEII